jgi:glycosyltransferase involved in cell wall biosynthesis
MTEEEFRFPIVTAVIHTYNHEKYITEAIESVLAQTIVKDIEVVVIDDCSTDETSAIVKYYEIRYPKLLRVFTNSFNRQGLGYHPGSEALRTVRTKYVAFLDGDDYWTDEKKLEKQVLTLEFNPDLSGCAHATGIHNSVTSPSKYWRYSDDEQLVEFRDIAQPKTPFHTSSFMMRSGYLGNFLSVYQKNPTCISGDLVLYAVAAANGPIAFSPQVMSVYRLHPDGITHGSVHRSPFSFFHNRSRMWREIGYSLNIQSNNLVELIEAFQAQALKAFSELEPTIVLLANEVARPPGYEEEKVRRTLLETFRGCEVMTAFNQDKHRAYRPNFAEYSSADERLFVYTSPHQFIEFLERMLRKSSGPMILCSVNHIAVDKIIKSVFNNSAFVISSDIANCISTFNDHKQMLFCFNQREYGLRFLKECKLELMFCNDSEFLRYARLALGKFKLDSPDVVSVVH